MIGRRRRPWTARGGALLAVLLISGGVALNGQPPVYADAHAPPPFPTNCPGAEYPPQSPHYEVPFKGIIFGGEIDLPPNVKVPNLYASVCGLVQLPDLSGSIEPDNIAIATPNVYVGGLEALPSSLLFKELVSTIKLQAAANGGLDISLHGPTTSQVSTLGMTCGVTINATFSTMADGKLAGRPVTGPTESGEAEVVSNSFGVGAVSPSNSCPPSIAQTFNKLLGLPAAPGVGTFTAPFCFDFELEGPNNPAQLSNPSTGKPPLNPDCPWPSH
jgi:hypothetical protein